MEAALDDNTDKNGRHMPTQNWLRHSEPPPTLWPNNFAYLALSPSIMGQIEKKALLPVVFLRKNQNPLTRLPGGLRVLLYQTVEGRSSYERSIPAATSSGGFLKLGSQ